MGTLSLPIFSEPSSVLGVYWSVRSVRTDMFKSATHFLEASMEKNTSHPEDTGKDFTFMTCASEQHQKMEKKISKEERILNVFNRELY